MDVLLKVEYIQEYDVIIRDVESVEQAKKVFDPCEDLEGLISTYGNAKPLGGYEIKDCPDCEGKGYHFLEGTDGCRNSSKQCSTCKGERHVKVEDRR